jgi:SAM-dependent methyltransferase
MATPDQHDRLHHDHHDHGPNEGRISADRAQRLMDPARLRTQLSEQDLARLLALRGDEDVIELGSGAGFYTDRIAALTSGTVTGVDIQPEMHEFYRSRGLPANVRLRLGDVTHLDLPAASLDVACSISTWHESDGVIDLAGLHKALRAGGRLVVVDWRRDDDSPEHGPPMAIRFSKEDVAASLAPLFRPVSAESLGEHMFAVVAVRADLPGRPD